MDRCDAGAKQLHGAIVIGDAKLRQWQKKLIKLAELNDKTGAKAVADGQVRIAKRCTAITNQLQGIALDMQRFR